MKVEIIGLGNADTVRLRITEDEEIYNLTISISNPAHEGLMRILRAAAMHLAHNRADRLLQEFLDGNG